MARILESSAPASLVGSTATQLQTRVDAYFEALLKPDDLRFDARVQFSGRTVIAPGPEFDLDEIGLPEELAWRLFAPFLIGEVGDELDVSNRTKMAAETPGTHRHTGFSPRTDSGKCDPVQPAYLSLVERRFRR
jgi:DNA-directed RNA polymerase beta' subunit